MLTGEPARPAATDAVTGGSINGEGVLRVLTGHGRRRDHAGNSIIRLVESAQAAKAPDPAPGRPGGCGSVPVCWPSPPSRLAGCGWRARTEKRR